MSPRLKQHRALFTSSERAVVREREPQMTASADERLLQIVECATSAGWEVKPNANGGRLFWYNPDKSKRPVSSPTRITGRGFENLLRDLRQAGLDTSKIKDATAKAKPDSPKKVAADGSDGLVVVASVDEKGEFTYMGKAAQKIQEIVTRPDGSFDDELAEFFGSFGDALDRYLKALHLKKDNTSDELLLEAMEALEKADAEHARLTTENESLREQLDRRNEQITELGRELRDAMQQKAAAEERAHTAEQQLNTMRSILAGT